MNVLIQGNGNPKKKKHVSDKKSQRNTKTNTHKNRMAACNQIIHRLRIQPWTEVFLGIGTYFMRVEYVCFRLKRSVYLNNSMAYL